MREPVDLERARRLLQGLGAVRRQLRRSVGRPFPGTELTGSQIELVRLVRHEPGITVSEAAERLGVAPNTVSTLVRRLTDDGLLRKEPDEADRRIGRLHLTTEAGERFVGWRDRRAESVAHALDRLDDDDRQALEQAAPALDRLAAALQEGEQ